MSQSLLESDTIANNPAYRRMSNMQLKKLRSAEFSLKPQIMNAAFRRMSDVKQIFSLFNFFVFLH